MYIEILGLLRTGISGVKEGVQVKEAEGRQGGNRIGTTASRDGGTMATISGAMDAGTYHFRSIPIVPQGQHRDDIEPETGKLRMDLEKAAQAIRKIAPTSKTAQLRKILPLIEERMADGVRLAAIHEALVMSGAFGFELTIESLRTILARHRKAQRQCSIPAPSPAAAPASHLQSGGTCSVPQDQLVGSAGNDGVAR